MLKRLILAAVGLLTIAGVVSAAELEGILLDRMCATKIVQKGMKAAQAHTRECALMPDCAKSGYGIYTADGKYLTFDAAGNKQAQAALRASKRENNLRVKVSGEVQGGTVKVSSLKIL